MISYAEMVDAVQKGMTVHLPEIRSKDSGEVLYAGGAIATVGGLPHPSLLAVGTKDAELSVDDLEREIAVKKAILDQVKMANARAEERERNQAEAQAKAQAESDALKLPPATQADLGPDQASEKAKAEEAAEVEKKSGRK